MIFDVEADGLLDKATKIHCLSYSTPDGVRTLTSYQEMRDLLLSAPLLIGHNIICYDVPLLEKLLRIKIKARLIDTLPLSWYLNHKRVVHGLDSFGKDFGIPKPKIDDWENLTIEEYSHRCEEDVKINTALWLDLRKRLLSIYDDREGADRLLNYLSFKMDCIREQESSRWKLDKELATTSLTTLEQQQEEKVRELIAHMPSVEKFVNREKPKKPFKQDGTYSVQGAKWFKLLSDEGFPEDYDGYVTVKVGEVAPNPNSHDQIKAWLYSLGWVPETFKFVKGDSGERRIPQVRVDTSDGKALCPSVTKLIPDNPAVGVLEGLTIIQHRISIFKGFLSNEVGGYLRASAGGLTNTLRFKHRVLVNLPGVNKPWGQEIRGCLTASEGNILCGSDMCSLEETTKKHYMFPYDPDFVEEMSKEGFDAHLDLAKHAGAVTQDEIDAYVKGVDGAKNLKPIRTDYKAANYSCIYGVGAPKLARELGISVAKASKLIEAYWKRNWSVKTLSADTKIKRVNGEMWLFNPVSKLYYSLRNEKDIFSTLNQGTGVFCFDSWIREVRKVRPQLTGQFHDECILDIKKGSEEKCKALLKRSIQKVNENLQLNVKLDVDVQFGETYADVH